MTIDLLLHNVTLAVPVHLRSQAHTWPLQGQTVSSANPCRRQPLELLSTIFDAGMLLGWQGASGTSRIELTSSALTRYYTCAVPERLQEMHHFIFTYPLFEDTLSKDTLQERRMHSAGINMSKDPAISHFTHRHIRPANPETCFHSQARTVLAGVTFATSFYHISSNAQTEPSLSLGHTFSPP